MSGLLLLLASSSASAYQLEFFDGELAVDIAHELNYGVAISTQKASKRILYGRNVGGSGDTPGNGGRNSGPYDDDARMAFSRGVWANQFKGVTDIRANLGDFGTFVRLLYFYDYEIMNRPRGTHNGIGEKITYGKFAKREIGRDLRTQEAFAYWDSYIGDTPVTVRIGDQIIRWGQTTFMPGVNIINPPDLNRLFTPGFNLRELRRPIGSFLVSATPLDWLTVEAYAQYDWQPVGLPPGGSFMAVNDPLGPGAQDDYTGTALACLDNTAVDTYPERGGGCVNLGKALTPDGDQFGLRLQFNVGLAYLTQFSMYAIRFHNRFPNIGGLRTGVVPNLIDCNRVKAVVTANVAGIPGAGVLAGLLDCSLASDQNFTADQLLDPRIYFDTDREMYGFSWLGNAPFGFTWAGEVSLKPNYPIQVARPEFISAVTYVDVDGTGPAPIMSLREVDDLTNGLIGTPRGIDCRETRSTNCNVQVISGQEDGAFAQGVNAFPADGGAGFSRSDVLQANLSLTKLWPNLFGGDVMVNVLELIYVRAMGMRDDIQFEIPDFTDYNNVSRADRHGWGYRFLARQTYAGIFESKWVFQPTLVWQHDVKGSPPANLGTFLEGRRQVILDLGFKYRSFLATFRYMYFSGAKEQNIWQDRDTLFINFRWTL